MSPEKRSKKDKKRKKEKKHKKQRSDDAVDKDKNPAVSVPFDSNIAAAVSRTSDTSVSTFSWESAFAAAATIQPEDLDEAFLNRTSTPLQDDGLAKIALLSQEQKKSKAKESETDLPREKTRTSTDQVHVTKKKEKKEKKKKKKRTRSASNDVAVALNSHEEQDAFSGLHAPENNPLEGKMVSHPTHHGEQIMVLVDTKQATIFSAFDRTPNGNLIPIGKMVAGEAILDKDALSEKNDDGKHNDQEGDRLVTEKSVRTNEQTSSTQPHFPYPTDPDDHCETPVAAYKDISPFLQKLCDRKKGMDSLAIYDPYYCDGAVVRNLATIGFTNVHNRKEDCYETWSSAGTGTKHPLHYDVLLTNPPYSDEHIPKLMEYVTCKKKHGNRPWFLLMPTWVHKKDYYKKIIERTNCRPFYLVPKKRYVYLPPKDFRDKKASDVHKKSSPFVSMWFCWGGTTELTELLMDHFLKNNNKVTISSCDLARSKSALRDLRRKDKKK